VVVPPVVCSVGGDVNSHGDDGLRGAASRFWRRVVECGMPVPAVAAALAAMRGSHAATQRRSRKRGRCASCTSGGTHDSLLCTCNIDVDVDADADCSDRLHRGGVSTATATTRDVDNANLRADVAVRRLLQATGADPVGVLQALARQLCAAAAAATTVVTRAELCARLGVPASTLAWTKHHALAVVQRLGDAGVRHARVAAADEECLHR
jgi:hypothetical protein